MKKGLNYLGTFLAMALSLISLYLWYSDGSWEEGQLPSSALIQILILSGVSLLCFGILRGLTKK